MRRSPILTIVILAAVLSVASLLIERKSVTYYPLNSQGCAAFACGGNYREYRRYRGLPFNGYYQDSKIRNNIEDVQGGWIWLGNVLNFGFYTLIIAAFLGRKSLYKRYFGKVGARASAHKRTTKTSRPDSKLILLTGLFVAATAIPLLALYAIAIFLLGLAAGGTLGGLGAAPVHPDPLWLKLSEFGLFGLIVSIEGKLISKWLRRLKGRR